MNKLILHIVNDWAEDEYLIFNNERDLVDYFSDNYQHVEITQDQQLILKNNGIKTVSKLHWGKHV